MPDAGPMRPGIDEEAADKGVEHSDEAPDLTSSLGHPGFDAYQIDIAHQFTLRLQHLPAEKAVAVPRRGESDREQPIAVRFGKVGPDPDAAHGRPQSGAVARSSQALPGASSSGDNSSSTLAW